MNEPPTREMILFNEALALLPAERPAFLGEACATDGELRRAVQALLDAHEDAGAFLNAPLGETRLFPPGSPAAYIHAIGENTRPAQKPGDKIGRYKLLEQIGEGGCGVVFMAEQEAPVRRRVALKVIKLGMDTKQVIARFEAERQALALMDHPNIAKVFDAGSTERPLTRPADTLSPVGEDGRGEGLSAGRPYFVMELVRGVKITDYCDENNLTAKERLDLFMQVCRAIQHAHQKGIIHRDIKPSNILVTINDGVPVPKVIDFGIAKATQGRLTDRTLFTAFQQFIGTPAYMSPEQAVMTSLDIDTRSDIYSLGVLLYELLTGKTPFDTEELLAAGLDEMRRTIREKEPERPSTVVRRLSQLRAESPKASWTQGRPPLDSQLKSLSTDLDWIVMRCLEKDRSRRYETANGLAADIQRHLSQEPVLACPPSNLYRLQKMLRRNKLVFTAGVCVAAALVVGLGAATWMFFREREARNEQTHLRQEAQTEAARSQQVAELLQKMLKGVGPSVALGRDTRVLREILDETTERLGKGLTNQPEVEAELRTTIGEVYYELGEYGKAEAMEGAALALLRTALGNRPSGRVARSLADLGRALVMQERLGEAETASRAGLDMARRMFGNTNTSVAFALDSLAHVLYRRGKLTEAEMMYREALAIFRKALGNENHEVAVMLNGLGVVLAGQGRLADAESIYRDALVILRKLLGNEHPELATALSNLGELLVAQGKFAEAETMHHEVLATRKKLLGNGHPDLAVSLYLLATVLDREKKDAEAEPVWREALANARRYATNDPRRLEGRLANLAGCLRRQEKYGESENLYREALHSALRFASNSPPRLGTRISDVARVLQKQGKVAEAEQFYRELVPVALENQPASAGLLWGRGEALARRGRWKEAGDDMTKAVAFQPTNHEPYIGLSLLLLASQDLDGYRQSCKKILARFAETKNPDTADWVAKACVLLPSSGVDLEIIDKVSDIGLEKRHYFPKALCQYRQGNFASAVEWGNAARDGHSASGSSQDMKESWLIRDYALLAMSKFQLQRADEVNAAWAEAVGHWKTQSPKLESGGIRDDWWDWIFADVLMKEAKALIEGDTKIGAGTK